MTANPITATVNDACERYGVGRTLLYALLKEGAIRAVKCRGRTLVDIASADAYFRNLPAYQPIVGDQAVSA